MRHWRYKALFWDYDKDKWDWIRKSAPKKYACLAKYCPNDADLYWEERWGKRRLVQRPFCTKCMSRRWRCNNPMHTLHSELKRSANKRKIPFDLTYGELLQFCLENDFYRKSPKFTKDSLTIDRILPIHGYSIWNIQVLTNTENTAKGNTERKKHAKHYQQPDNDDPF